MKRWLALIFILSGCMAPDYYNIGQKYLGATYLDNPLGEELPPDTDPLIRTDAFDCTTFVETALADGDVEKLTKIRYKDGKVGFVNRNHFIETDWLINNSDIVADVTTEYGDVATRTVTIDKQNWMHHVYNIDAEFEPQTVLLKYIPYDNLRQIDVSEPLIVLFIAGNFEKRDIIGTDLAVRHMGFLLPGGVLRHASSQHGRVLDVDFYEYAMQRAKNKNNIGIMLVKIK